MSPDSRTPLAQLVMACAAIGLLPSAQAVLLEAGDMAGAFGISLLVPQDTSFLYVGPDTSAIKDGAHIVFEKGGGPFEGNNRDPFKEDRDPFTVNLKFLYMATDEVGFEVGLNWPTKFKQTVKYQLRGQYEAEIVTFTLIGKWFFFSPDDEYRPYIGLGLHHAGFRKEKVKYLPFQKLDLDTKTGYIGTLGLVYGLDETSFLDTSLSFHSIKARGKVQLDPLPQWGSSRGIVKDVKLHPLLFNVGCGVKF